MNKKISFLEYTWKSWETYSMLTVKTPVIVRLDGNNFHNLTNRYGFNIPFDEKFHQAMINVTTDLMIKTGFQMSLAHTSSDEISLLFTKYSQLPHYGRVEKILTLLSAYATSSFQHQIGGLLNGDMLISFDSRIIKINSLSDILEYFTWRVSASFRNFLNVYAQHYIGKKQCEGLKGKELINMLTAKGFKIESTPDWQKYGTILYWKTVQKKSFNRKTKQKAKVFRRKLNQLTVNMLSSTGRKWLEKIIKNI